MVVISELGNAGWIKAGALGYVSATAVAGGVLSVAGLYSRDFRVGRWSEFYLRLIFAAGEPRDHGDELARADRFGDVHLIARS